MRGSIVQTPPRPYPEDDWIGITEGVERKRRQNRLNQRARRLRKEKAMEKEKSENVLRPFRVQRWRVRKEQPPGPDRIRYATARSPAALDTPDFSNVQEYNKDSIAQLEPILGSTPHFTFPTDLPTFEFPLSPDHLLIHLIHYNVFRALTSNKSLLATTSTLTKPADQGFLVLFPSFTSFCDGLTIIEPLEKTDIPPFLYPTSVQRNLPHSSWINMFPFPRFRENLIQLEGVFDATDLCNDLFGEIFTGTSSPANPESSEISTPTDQSEGSEWDDDSPVTGRKGLIAWGEPWDRDGWEITPGFLRKWTWLLNGCNDMIEAGNRWRAKRSEPPLPLIVESVSHTIENDSVDLSQKSE